MIEVSNVSGARPSAVEDGQVEPEEALRVGDHIDFHNLAARDGEPYDRDRLPAHGHDNTRGSVHQWNRMGMVSMNNTIQLAGVPRPAGPTSQSSCASVTATRS